MSRGAVDETKARADHAAGKHKKLPRQSCPDCKATRLSIARLHRVGCDVPMWEMVGQKFAKPRPSCTCGADKAVLPPPSNYGKSRTPY
jgi:hypothetical protein